MTDADTRIEPTVGWVDEEIQAEFPGLRLRSVTLDARSGRSSRGVKQRLKAMSDRFYGAQAVTLRQDPVPWAYRVFYRHIGLDPDAQRTPIEEAAVQRLLHGQFRSENQLDDALLIALMETAVPIWALDAAGVDGQLGIRLATAGERLGRSETAPGLPSGRMVVADQRSPLAVLFGELAPGHGVTGSTTAMTLFSLQVQGVPEIHVEEALWTCVSILGEG
jgi:DNA/RNA-binding domain of Phe-tRNA-synthetase-like protein